MGASVRIAVAIAALAALLPATAFAAYPGSNGKLAFERHGQIWTVNADGSGPVQLTTGAGASTEPAWSPDGKKIAYTHEIDLGLEEIRIMNADGTQNTALPNWHPPERLGHALGPTWAPRGDRIAFVEIHYDDGGVCNCFHHYVVETNLTGGERRYIFDTFPYPIPHSDALRELEWSPRGHEIALTREDGYDQPPSSLIATAGTNWYPPSYREHTGGSPNAYHGSAWSPDGAQLLYILRGEPAGRLYRVDADGSSTTFLTSGIEDGVEWSPDGTRLAGAGPDPACDESTTTCPPELWVMDPSGTNRVRLTNSQASERNPDWQPVLGAPAAGYPRPRSTSTMRISLVPAYEQCTAPNRTHGPPLAFPSCAPPDPSSPWQTVGTPDAGGGAANMVGSLRLKTLPGNPATTADEADLKVDFDVTDVRCQPQRTFCGEANAAGGRDHRSALEVSLALRVTDRHNLPAPGGRDPGTGDAVLAFHPACSPTPSDTSVGSTCRQHTSVDVLLPGLIKEGARTVLEIGQVEVLDDGGDGAFGSGDPSLPLFRQGVFVP